MHHHLLYIAYFTTTSQETLAKLLDSGHEEHEQPAEQTNENTENDAPSKHILQLVYSYQW